MTAIVFDYAAINRRLRQLRGDLDALHIKPIEACMETVHRAWYLDNPPPLSKSASQAMLDGYLDLPYRPIFGSRGL